MFFTFAMSTWLSRVSRGFFTSPSKRSSNSLHTCLCPLQYPSHSQVQTDLPKITQFTSTGTFLGALGLILMPSIAHPRAPDTLFIFFKLGWWCWWWRPTLAFLLTVPGQSHCRNFRKPVWPFTRAFSRTLIKETNTQLPSA